MANYGQTMVTPAGVSNGYALQAVSRYGYFAGALAADKGRALRLYDADGAALGNLYPQENGTWNGYVFHHAAAKQVTLEDAVDGVLTWWDERPQEQRNLPGAVGQQAAVLAGQVFEAARKAADSVAQRAAAAMGEDPALFNDAPVPPAPRLTAVLQAAVASGSVFGQHHPEYAEQERKQEAGNDMVDGFADVINRALQAGFSPDEIEANFAAVMSVQAYPAPNTPDWLVWQLHKAGLDNARLVDHGSFVDLVTVDLPDGRGVIFSNASDAAPSGLAPDAQDEYDSEVLAGLYESAAANAHRWPDGEGLDYNDPVEFFAGTLTEVLAAVVAWHGVAAANAALQRTDG